MKRFGRIRHCDVEGVAEVGREGRRRIKREWGGACFEEGIRRFSSSGEGFLNTASPLPRVSKSGRAVAVDNESVVNPYPCHRRVRERA